MSDGKKKIKVYDETYFYVETESGTEILNGKGERFLVLYIKELDERTVKQFIEAYNYGYKAGKKAGEFYIQHKIRKFLGVEHGD